MSGGALKQSKFSVHVANWAFTSQGAPILMTDNAKFSDSKAIDPNTERALKLQ
jgi:hypothetical protein